MRRSLWIVFVAACLGALVSPVQGSIFLSANTANGVPDQFKDNSRSWFIDNGDQVVGPADVIYGLLKVTDKIQPTGEAGPVPAMVTAIFSLTNGAQLQGPPKDVVLDVTNTAGNYRLANLGTQVAADLGLVGYVQDLDWTNLINANPNAMIAIVSKLGGGDPTLDGRTSLVDLLRDDGVANSIGGGTMGGGWEIELLAGRNISADFFQIKLTGNSPIDPSGTPIGEELAGLSVLYTQIGSGPTVWKPVPTVDELGNHTTNDMFVTANVQTFSDQSAWTFQDNTNFTLNELPEPCTFVVWAIGLLAVCLYWRRRA